MTTVGVVITGGGRGRRMKGRIPKQFLRLQGKTIIEHTVDRFHPLRDVDQIVLVVPQSHVGYLQRMVTRKRLWKVSHVVAGGTRRQHSVWNGLAAFDSPPDIVLVHDAVRPFVSKKDIAGVIRSAKKTGAAVVGVRISDTVKVEGRRGFFSQTLNRAFLWTVQTPQAFRYSLLMDAHRHARRSGFLGTDEASLVERLGLPVKIVEGDRFNLKITTPEDLKLAKALVKTPKTLRNGVE
jgi:2-C-methyl-D-erythritol 4-phosphate cytidylyltransferase